MKTLILILIAGLFDGGTTIDTTYHAKDKYVAWNAACFYTPYVCDGVPVPKVKKERMSAGLQGYYDGSDTIFIKNTLRGRQLREVLMHEMVHYLQVQKGGLEVPGLAEPICRAENEAFTVVDEWLIAMGWKSLVVGPNWWRAYPHCWEFFDPNWPTYSEIDKDIWTLGPSEG